ncbi:hypothetical protein GCM10007897_32110 [Sphingobium jiangsuense]|uniref:Tip attachment protein J domain-containing protein n=1 Tax=Sphingobium jiangsuense TaxID=870476 RepID=A0A7W6BK27_9SPHN|nr:hypothetical protein [Sphingobium jiangsuense]MBB3928323.1 hypothetical protein [Sphingobium jiangsuense]GLT01813.1 hypothetical protein GCM10007897_32110 [Sphingobium jiangsuense]
MAKALKTVGTVVAVVALAATGVGLAAGGAVAAAAGSATAATAMSVAGYAGLASGVLGAVSALAFKPKFTSQGSPTRFTTNPQSGIPYAFGRTRMSGLRIFADTYDGFKVKAEHDVLAFLVMLSAGGQIDAIEKFTADNEVVTFKANGNANGKFEDYMNQAVHLGGYQDTALPFAFGGKSPPGLTAAHKLSGITHARWSLRFDTDGKLYGAGVPEPAWIGRWVRVYDPRLDSAYPGGSGPCRALDESTYVWSRNPALHALTWCLGRWQNGKKVLGIGAPVANIRVADFVEAANVADANGWHCGGVEWSTDSKWSILKRMLQAGGAVPTMTGAMIGCRAVAPRISIATITSADLLDELTVAATKPRRERFNTVIPRYRSEAHEWEIISAAPVSVPAYVTMDGGVRQKEIDYPLVQAEVGQAGVDGDLQAGQLAAYDIVNSREAGPISWTTGPKFIGLKTGDCVTLHVPDEGLDNQPVIITSVSLDPSTAKISFTAETETASKHAFALGQTAVPPTAFALTPPPVPLTPEIEDWSLSAALDDNGMPYLALTGDVSEVSIGSVLIQYRRAADLEWSAAGIVVISSDDEVHYSISGVDGAAEYLVRVAYQTGTALGDWLELGPVTAPANAITALIDDLQTTIDAKRTVFIQPNAPSAAESEENDWWQQTTADRSQVIATYRRVAGSGLWGLGGDTWAIDGDHLVMAWTPVEDARISDALQAATDASNLADSKAVVFTMYSAGDAVPVGTDIGDMLVRAYLSPVQVDYWNGTNWAAAATFGATSAQVASIAQALTDAANAQATADGKIDSFYQASAPSGGSLGDLWFDTDDGNKQYRHDGSSWVAVQDEAIGAAISAAAGAQATADGKVTTFVGEATPTPEGDGDLWYKASSQTLSRWNGSAWVVVSSLGAPAGTNVGSTPSTTVESGANAANNGVNSDGTIKTDKVDTPAIVDNAVTSLPSVAGTSVFFTNSPTLAASYTFTPAGPSSNLLVLISGVVRLDGDNVAGTTAYVSLLRDGGTDLIASLTVTDDRDRRVPFCFFATISGLSGAQTFSLYVRKSTSGNTNGQISRPAIAIVEGKK